MTRPILVALGMALVTAIPRVIPMIFLGGRKLHPFWDDFFRSVPYAVLGALIVPDVFIATGERLSSVAGAAAAVFLAWRGLNPTAVVFGAIAASALVTVLKGGV